MQPPTTMPSNNWGGEPGFEAQSSNELLVTFVSTSGEEECAVVRIANTYEETLEEACTSLAPWLPSDWQDRRRDFAREVRNRKGDMIWATVQPALVLELGRLGRLPELRLRVHPPTDEGPGAHLNNQHDDTRSPAYEAVQQPSAVDGIVQAVLHRLQNQDEDNNTGNPPAANTGPTISAADEKKALEEQYRANAPVDPPSRPPAPPPRLPPLPTTAPTPPPNPAMPPPIPSNVPIMAPQALAARRRPQNAENNQLPTPQSPPFQPPPWASRPPPTPPWVPEVPPAPEPTNLNQRNARPPPQPTSPKVEGTSAQSVSLSSVLQTCTKSISDGNHEGALKALRLAANTTDVPKEQAKLYLWLGQIGCEIKEYHNASTDITIARDLFASFNDHSGRLECQLVIERIARARDSASTPSDAKLKQLLAEAQRKQLKKVEIIILCELCELACTTRDTSEMVSHSERAKSMAQMSGDMWYKAETSRISGMVSEANGDIVTALQSYSGALELYRGATPRSPLLPVKNLEESISRMRYKLSSSMNKQNRSRFKFF